MSKDLVCGMNVDERKAAAKTDHEGKAYYFCSAGCKNAFQTDPEKYIKFHEERREKHHCGCC